ncbi:mannose-ethanolamine phosphotransferase gpi13 [Puttea exsequens]|nr:mannose-ethanolamine phosphotransferase gpi13 [Puttea exsequens]
MEANGKAAPPLGYKDLTSQYNEARSNGHMSEDATLHQSNRKKEVQFKASQFLLIGVFFWVFILHAVGIFLFTRGFLLTRLVLDRKSECASPPIRNGLFKSPGTVHDGCWHPKSFDKAVVIIIDALRYDFTVPFSGEPHHFHNALTILDETARQSPENAFLLPFIADPPTTTLQRLKGLTTGTLPTFIDAGSNFAGTAIEEDNLIGQLRDAGKTLVHLGDDTWHALFPGYFDSNLTHAYDSFNVWDLYTVDNGVTEHLLPLLKPESKGNWDVIFGHYLGVDHAGHRYGPDHPTTNVKLREMDEVIRKIMTELDDDTLLVIMGDHGMDVKGDHGGESDDEVEAALWMYSKRGIFGRGHNGLMAPPMTAKERPVGQIDLVPTLSLLLGMPIPFNNLGAPISEAFVGPGKPDWQNLASVNALAAAQIDKYQQEYAHARNLDDSVFDSARRLWEVGMQNVKYGTTQSEDSFEKFQNFQRENLRICRSLWARFDIPSMLAGITILASGVLVLAFYAISPRPANTELAPVYLAQMTMFGLGGAVATSIIGFMVSVDSWKNAGLVGLAMGGIAGFARASINISQAFSIPFPRSVWGWLAVIFTLSQSIGYASNSFTIWEDEILLCFLSTFAVLAFTSSVRQEYIIERVLGMFQAGFFLILTRLGSFSRLCREEQMPYCRSTYYASTTSSTSAPWQLIVPLLSATFLPSVIKKYYEGTRSYQGSAKLWIGFALRISLLLSSIFWILDAADDNDWLQLSESTLQTTKITLARLILGAALFVGTTAYIMATPCISIEVTSNNNSADTTTSTTTAPRSVKVYGYANVHGTRYFLLFTAWLAALSLLQKPMGSGALSILTLQILALLEILDTNALSQSAIGPIVLGLLGSFHFFKTGHQATLSSIQWESAFIPLRTITYPFSPLLVVLNSFGAQILTTVAVPLTALWKQPPKKPRLLSDVARALATLLLYYAVINLATTMWAGWLRRHLMLYRIFSPRFMTGAAVLLVVDLVGIFVGLGSLRWNFGSVAEVFGWS